MAEWQNRVIERRIMKVKEIAVNKRNPKSHPFGQQERLRAMLDKFGMVSGGLLAFYDDENLNEQGRPTLTLFDGHARQGLDPDQEWEICITDLSRAECDELVLFFDPISALAQPDASRQMDLMQDLRDVDGVLGAFLDELARGSGFVRDGNGNEQSEPETPIDKAEELQKKWNVKTGDIWQMGRHFIICGDCREPETWQQLLDAAGVDKIQGLFTSPPYAEQRKAQYGGVPTDEYVEWWGTVQANVRAALAEDGNFFVNIKPHTDEGQRVLYVFDLVCAMVRQWQWYFIDELCWRHWGYPQEVKRKFKNCFEPVYHFATGAEIVIRPNNVLQPYKDIEKTKRDIERYGYGRRYSPTKSGTNKNLNTMISRDMALPGNVLEIPQDAGFLRDKIIQDIHSATFPVALPSFFLKAYSDPGDVWLDPFAGSGTTGVAAHREKRIGLMIEQLPKYVSVVLERFEGLGLTPIFLA